MNKIVGSMLFVLGGVAAGGGTNPVLAAPLSAGSVGAIAAAVDSRVTNVRSERRARKYGRAYRREPYRSGYYPGGDNVGSIVRDGYGYGYNRFSGERYYSCMIDLGYGRVQPCDAGGGPN